MQFIYLVRHRTTMSCSASPLGQSFFFIFYPWKQGLATGSNYCAHGLYISTITSLMTNAYTGSGYNSTLLLHIKQFVNSYNRVKIEFVAELKIEIQYSYILGSRQMFACCCAPGSYQ